ncbi:hypothetical protein [Bacteroides cellulosilyticus]|uniref:hypothetical protein n=1 Tax=Bacteroides cellulosilyticus TaxID=246787 RepID=UPI00356796A7
MKKYVLMSAVGMMMLAACSDDESVAMDKQDPPSLSEITLSLNSGGDGLNTRANRPVTVPKLPITLLKCRFIFITRVERM